MAARLGIGVYDKQLINLAAEQSGICPEIFEKADEKESRNLFATFIGYLRSPFVGSEYSGSNVLSSDALFKIQSDVIRDLASRESCVFVGRCADYILRDHPRTVNIFFAAGRAERIERLCRLHGIAPGEAESLMDRTDARRAQASGALYLAWDGVRAIGSMVLNHDADPDYAQVPGWGPDADWPHLLLIHTLAVHPAYQGRGLARRLLAHAEVLARQSGMRALRLDVCVGNAPAIRLYEQCGFACAGTAEMHFCVGTVDPCRLYEKTL